MSIQHVDMTDKTLIFLHLGKTGGTSLNTILDWSYPRDAVFSAPHYPMIDTFKNLPEAERAQIKCLKGQVFYGIHQWVPRDFTYVTLLRHPVKRAISQYLYFRTRAQHEGSSPGNLRIERFLEWDEPFRHQLGLIVGGDDPNEIHRTPLPADAVAIAKRHLEKDFSVVGITEHFAESFLMMKKMFGWRVPFYARKNVAPHPERARELSPQVIQRIEQKCAAEIELYDYVRSQFEARLQDQTPSFFKEVEQIKRNSALYNWVWQTTEPVRTTRFWRYVRRALPRYPKVYNRRTDSKNG